MKGESAGEILFKATSGDILLCSSFLLSWAVKGEKKIFKYPTYLMEIHMYSTNINRKKAKHAKDQECRITEQCTGL